MVIFSVSLSGSLIWYVPQMYHGGPPEYLLHWTCPTAENDRWYVLHIRPPPYITLVHRPGGHSNTCLDEPPPYFPLNFYQIDRCICAATADAEGSGGQGPGSETRVY